MMFLHSGASLHGHEYNRPSPTNAHLHQQRKKPFLRSALPAPILYTASATVSEVQPSSQTFKPRTRPVSEVHYRPISDLYPDDPPHQSSLPSSKQPTAPVVRFKDIDLDEPLASPMSDDDPSLYDSDASQTTASTPRRRRRKTTPRSSTNFLLAVPPPRTSTKKALLKATRAKLLLQLQELPSNQRPIPSIDVFPASLLAGTISTTCCVTRFSRLFGAKGEIGPRDLVLVQSEDYTNGEEDKESGNERQKPIAVIRRGRAQGDKEEIVMDDGTVWTCTDEKGFHSFVHVDEHGRSMTARWVKRSGAKRVSSLSSTRTSSSSNSNPGIIPNAADSTDPDYRYTFSLINPLSRRHPILAALTPQSLEIFDSYTTPSASQGRYPPTRPMSCIIDSGSSVGSESPRSPLFEEPFTRRETHLVEKSVKKLITITSLWLTMRNGPAGPIVPVTDCASDAGASDLCSQDSIVSAPPGLTQARTMPRRQTTNHSIASAPTPQPTGLRRAMSTGAAFMHRRRQKQQQSSLETTTSDDTTNIEELEKVIETEGGNGSPDENVTATTTTTTTSMKENPKRRSWFRKLTQ